MRSLRVVQEAFRGRVKRALLFSPAPILFGILLLNMSVLQLAAQTESPERSLLDGTMWIIKAKPFPQAERLGGKPFSDTLTFEQEKFTSTTCAKAGFAPTSYSRAMRDAPNDPWSFRTAEQVSDKGEKTAWAGTPRATPSWGR